MNSSEWGGKGGRGEDGRSRVEEMAERHSMDRMPWLVTLALLTLAPQCVCYYVHVWVSI